MHARRMPSRPISLEDADQRVTLHGVSWADYEALLSMRGESSAVRVAYLEGELELMSPSRSHEMIKKMLARLVETYGVAAGVEVIGAGSWTIRKRRKKRGAEPDECYFIGEVDEVRPDLAIEVVWTHGGIDKIEIYRGLGVPEVWIWKDEAIEVHRLTGERYVRAAKSALLPKLDLSLLVRFSLRTDQTTAVREFQALVTGAGAPKKSSRGRKPRRRR